MKEYKIESVQDMIDCTNEDNLDNFLVDLKALLTAAHGFRDISDAAILLADEKYIVNPIKTSGYTWIDDGKHEAHITIGAK